MTKTKVTSELIERAIAREPKAVREFVRVLEPVFRVRIGRVFLPERKTSRDEIHDLCQETLIALIVDASMLARLWDPSRGVPFEYYAGRIAERRALDCLRKRTEELWPDDQSPDVRGLEDENPSLERSIEDQDFSDKVLAVAREEQAEFGRRMFDLLYVKWLEVDEVCTIMRLKPGAVYTWISRFRRRIEEIASTMGGAV